MRKGSGNPGFCFPCSKKRKGVLVIKTKILQSKLLGFVANSAADFRAYASKPTSSLSAPASPT